MSLSEQFNVGARIQAVVGTAGLAISQSSATAATTQDGLTIDRQALGRQYYSAKAVAAFSFASGATGDTASIAIKVQHSSDGTSWDNYSTATNSTAVTFGNDTGGTTDYDEVQQSVNLNGARRYVRMQVAPPTYATDCSSGAGTFTGIGTWIFGGADELPAQ